MIFDFVTTVVVFLLVLLLKLSTKHKSAAQGTAETQIHTAHENTHDYDTSTFENSICEDSFFGDMFSIEDTTPSQPFLPDKPLSDNCQTLPQSLREPHTDSSAEAFVDGSHILYDGSHSLDSSSSSDFTDTDFALRNHILRQYTISGKYPDPKRASIGRHRHAPNDSCRICFNDFEFAERVRWLPCLHTFHSGCLYQWLSRDFVCPICKHEISR